jgi:hypothetical protein
VSGQYQSSEELGVESVVSRERERENEDEAKACPVDDNDK